MMCEKNRIVLFLGAGFPIPWGAPLSQKLFKIVADEIKKTPFSFLTNLITSSFEDLIAALYCCTLYKHSCFQQILFQIKIPEGVNLDDAGDIYLRCVNIVMNIIHNYETTCEQKNNTERNECIRTLFRFLGKKYRHISIYTTNYDEVLPRVLNMPDYCLSLKDDSFHYSYSPISHHQLKLSYSNLHGSYHLDMSEYTGHQYEVSHTPLCKQLMNLHVVYGGNPGEIDLFTPIIMGHSKTQHILSKHFNYFLTCFANDLSDCDTFLAMGSSFSDLHLNSLIRQYTISRDVNYRIIDQCVTAYDSSIEDNFSTHIIGYGARYSPDSESSPIFVRENGKVVYYKQGVENFLKDELFWKKFL